MNRAILAHHIPLRIAHQGISEKVLIGLLTFTGVTAVAGGALLMAQPDGSLLQITPSALAALASNSPFPDFLIPGLVLAVIGAGMLGAAAQVFLHRHYAFEAAMAAGVALVVFELVEFRAIGFMPLQVFEGLVGLLVLGLAAQRRRATSTNARI